MVYILGIFFLGKHMALAIIALITLRICFQVDLKLHIPALSLNPSLSSGCVFTGIPPTQVHKHGNIGCIDVSTVLEPLDFVLPQREPVPPLLDLSIELSRLSTAEAEPLPLIEPEKVDPPVAGADLNLDVQQPGEAKPSHNSLQVRTDDEEQNDSKDTTQTSADDQNEALQPLPLD